MSFIRSNFETVEDRGEEIELPNTRIAPVATLMVGTAILTQLIVLCGIAIIMGVAVVTMCAFMVELVLLTVVATALERGVLTFEDIGTASELAATLLFTITAVMLATFGGDKNSGASPIIEASSVAALKL